jgi:putative endonuclease
MEFIVYVLFSEKEEKIYVGFTSNLDNRLISHNKLAQKGWAIKFRPWIVFYTETYQSKAEAMRREKQLKSSKGRSFIRNLIREKRGIGFISVS